MTNDEGKSVESASESVAEEDVDRFIWKTIGYLEGRIALMDNKANVMLALLTGTGFALPFALSTAGVKLARLSATWALVLLFLFYGALVLNVFLWLWVIRPNWLLDPHFLGTVMWLRPQRDPPVEFDYDARLTERSTALRETHRKLLRMASKKAWRYSWAMGFSKVFISIAIVAVPIVLWIAV